MLDWQDKLFIVDLFNPVAGFHTAPPALCVDFRTVQRNPSGRIPYFASLS